MNEARAFLDVGCGAGRLLELAKTFPDLLREGIELNVERAAFARQKADCVIHQIPLEKFTSDVKYDVITMVNVLSHIPSFDDLFAALSSLLAENGKVILKVGEMSSDVRKRDIFDWGIPDHLTFLGLNTIDFICAKYVFSKQYHQRIPIAKEMFSKEKWNSPGRSNLRNLIKKVIVNVPFALPILERSYRLLKGDRFYSSYIVLSPLP